MNWLKLVEQTQHCQRNWDHNKLISLETIDWLFDVGYNMPTKQNQSTIQIVAFTNKQAIQDLTDNAIPSEDFRGLIKNSQVSAPLVFGFFIRKEPLEVHGDKDANGNWHPPMKRVGTTVVSVEIGIASGAMALAANSIGLRTGFCICFAPLEAGTGKKTYTSKLLKKHNLNFKNLALLLGVGYPNDGIPSNQGPIIGGVKIPDYETFPKEYQAGKIII